MATGEAILFRERFEIPSRFRNQRWGRIHFCKALQTCSRPVKIPPQRFDFLLLSSDNALRYIKKKPNAKRTLRHLHGDQILRFFRSQKVRGRSILYLRSTLGASLGRSDIVPALRKMGYRVSVRCTYETKILSIRSRLLYLLKRHPIRSFLVTSPSAIQAVLRALTKRERKVLHVRWITMGPTTAAYLKRKNF